ncbi:hypothetical protein BTHI11S_00761 [Bosea thiooxidans]
MINTVVRQIAFYSFERRVHEARREGELTPEALCELWMGVQEESLGPAIRLTAGYEPYWCYIPHFIHSPFYVYAYAFGDCRNWRWVTPRRAGACTGWLARGGVRAEMADGWPCTRELGSRRACGSGVAGVSGGAGGSGGCAI